MKAIPFILLAGILACLAVFLLIQLVPYGRNHTNPTVVQEPVWNSPQTRALAQQACFDCHSNETVWPWYSNIAPISWLMYRDVAEGREKLNFSEWTGKIQGEREGEGEEGEDPAEEIVEVIQEGEMPLPMYLLTHPEAKLTTSEQQELISGFRTTLANR